MITAVMIYSAFLVMVVSLNLQGYIHPDDDTDRWAEETNGHPYSLHFFARLSEPGQIFDKNHTIKSLLPSIILFGAATTNTTISTPLTLAYSATTIKTTMQDQHRHHHHVKLPPPIPPFDTTNTNIII